LALGLAAPLALFGAPGAPGPLAGTPVGPLAEALPAVAPAAAAADYPQCPDANLQPAPDPDTMSRVENAIVCALNVERARAGREPFGRSYELDRSSGFQSADMVDHHFFAHEVKGHPRLLDRVLWSGYFAGSLSGYYAENLGAGPLQEATAAGIVSAWYGSAEHRTNILDARLSEIGVGSAIAPPDPAFYAGYTSAVYTTDFGARRRPPSSTPSPSDCPSPSSSTSPGTATVAPARTYCHPPSPTSTRHRATKRHRPRHRARRHRRHRHRHRAHP
jgi:uncharacterized protein YkwD